MPAKKYTTDYMNMSIPKNRYSFILDEWKQKIKPTTDLSFTAWVTETLENTVSRYRFLKKVFPDLRVIKTTESVFIIEDAATNEICKVYIKGTKLECTPSKNKDSMILFACLHPLFALK